MTPRKWTAADVKDEDMRAIRKLAPVQCAFYNLYDCDHLVSACWNRLEEKRSASEGGSIHLLRELEALEHNRESLIERHGLPGYRLRFPQMDDSIAEIKSRISGSDSGGSERQAALHSMDERQDPFFDADHLAEVGAYMEDRARKKLLSQALEALRAVVGSAHPHPVSHPSMAKAWPVAIEAIAALEKEVGA